MNINNIQGMNAYKANLLMADTASVQNKNKETGVEPNKESTQPVQKAFQIDITQEALALQAKSTENLAEEDQEQHISQQIQQAQSHQGRPQNQLYVVA